MPDSFELLRYRNVAGKVPISEWLADLDETTSGRITAYIDRMKGGNFGDSRSVGASVLELKIRFGAGYRVYYLRDGPSVVVLLCGGDKGTQKLDIAKAHNFAEDYRRRK